jgi:hypothetical protein
MSNTTNFNLVKPASTDVYNINDFNGNMDIIDAEMAKPPLTVNGVAPDSTTRNLTLTEVPLAGNLSSDIAQIVTGEFIQRTSGGDSPIGDGDAFIISIKGNSVHTGLVIEVLDMDVQAVERETPITATLNEETFKSYVSDTATITLTFLTSWSADPTLYGVTVTGTPVNGDTIVITYVKGNRGTITPASPSAFNATGWNLFNPTAGYAKVCKYSTTYGYRIGGSYNLVYFAETISGAQSAVTLEDGLFNIPSDGYVFVTGSDDTTYIYPTWTDWTSGYSGDFEAYTLETISLSEVMLNFPYGLCSVGIYHDEININAQTAIQRIERVAYTSGNLETVIAMGVPYECDTNYIYYVLETPNVTGDIGVNGEYTVSDHGIEYFSGTTVPVIAETLYGENLKDKLRTDVLTISEQTLTTAQKDQVWSNLGIDALDTKITGLGNAQVMTGYISGSSSDPTYGLETKTSAFTITGKALIIAGFAAPSGQSPAYTVHHRIDILTGTDSVYSSGADVQDNYGTVYRVNFRTAIITEPGTYKVCSRIIPQSGSTVSISDYSWGRLHVAVIPLE